MGGGVSIRRWSVDDAPRFHELITSSIEHLRPWMPWIAAEPLELPARETLLLTWMQEFESGASFTYAIVDVDDQVIGACGLHRRSAPETLEIGYWVGWGHHGRGAATAAVAALVEAGFAHEGIESIEIHHDAANVASGRVADRSGFTRIGEEPRRPQAPGESGIDVCWRLPRPA
ncbi:MAG: hypothetical protein RLZ04_1562 [Actinomycetota bacterium]|jgi:RimJ/RimL family protein N-acetyltransferase